MKKTVLLLFCLTVCLTVLLSSCGKTGSGTDTTASESSTDAVSTVETFVPESEAVPDYFNPLTGLGCDKDYTQSRPVAIMINNLWGALPQEGISKCDIMYECLVEGGITRLMVVSSDYSDLDVIGSIRSSRHYYLDLAQNYDALYVHAGGSTYAYAEIKSRGINNLDGVNMYIPDMFYRDAERMKTMSYEHTLMTTGEKIEAGIAYKKYRTDIKDEFKGRPFFNFTEYGEERIPDGGNATCVYLPYSNYQHARLDYNAETNTYYRYQFENVAHIDGTTGEQLNFTNVLILFCPVKVIAGDTYGRLDVTTEGSGTGYYVYGGKYEQITWEKPSEDSSTTYYGVDGNELLINRGKTFISIFPIANENEIQFENIPTK